MDNEENKPVEMTDEPNTIESAVVAQPAKKSNKKLVPLIAAFVVLLIICGTAIALTMINNNKSSNGGDGGKKDDALAKTVLDASKADKDKMYRVISLLNFTNYANNKDFVKTGNFKSTGYTTTNIPDLYINEGLTEKERVYAILFTAKHYDKKFEKIDETKYKESDFAKYISGNTMINDWKTVLEYVTILPAEYVESRYEEVFGEKISHQDAKEKCGGFNYDSKMNVYISGFNDGCGGVEARQVILHVNEISASTDEYYVDVNAVTSYASGMFADDARKCNIYKDVYTLDQNKDPNALDKNVYTKCEFNSNFGTDYYLTDEDADSVAKYRFTFDSEYHFKSIEKL